MGKIPKVFLVEKIPNVPYRAFYPQDRCYQSSLMSGLCSVIPSKEYTMGRVETGEKRVTFWRN